MNIEKALNLLAHYNGYEEIVKSLIQYIRDNLNEQTITPPQDLRYGDEKETIKAIFWFLLVCMYGEYGISPRFGWIEKGNDAIAFLDRLLTDED